MTPSRNTVVFDLGGVLIDWNPRHLYRKLFAGDDAAMERFLAEICTNAWNAQQDAGRTWAEGTDILTAEHPGHAPLIEAYRARWHEMLAGPIAGTVDILRKLKQRGVPLYALTNWSAETFPFAMDLFDFLGWFDGIVVSGDEKLIKPDPRIYALLLERHGLDAAQTVFIDDNQNNAAAATAAGMHGIHFTTPEALETELTRLDLL